MSGNGKSWPNASDYLDAVQNPSVVFSVDRLKSSKAQTNRMGLPRTRAGAFANVYKFEHAGGATAVRVFLNESHGRDQRYKAVTAHLKKKWPSSMVEFAHHEMGILVLGCWRPILTMEWVDGVTLGNWAQRTVEAGDVAALKTMAGRWLELVRELGRSEIAHGDLQHGNVMVLGDGRPVLVDYDCMAVPGLFDGIPLERGLPAYQHPIRSNPRRFDPQGRPPLHSPHLDTFSALVILTALRALAADLSLWDRFVSATRNENLLFTEQDHVDTKGSKLYEALARSPDPEVAEWSSRLGEWSTGPIDRYGPIDDLLVDPFLEVRAAAKRGDWDSVARCASASTRAIPVDLVAIATKAVARVKVRDNLRGSISSGDARKAAQLLQTSSSLLIDWPTARPLLDEAARISEAVVHLDELKRAAGTPALPTAWARVSAKLPRSTEVSLYETEADLWAAAAAKDWGRIVPLVHPRERIPCPDKLKAVVAEAQKKGRLRDQLEAALKSGDAAKAAAALAGSGNSLDDWPACAPLLADARDLEAAQRRARKVAMDGLLLAIRTNDDRRIAQAWSTLGSSRNDPDAIPYRSQAELATRRVAILESVGRLLLQARSEAVDKQIIDAWKVPTMTGCVSAASVRGDVDAARERIEAIQRVEAEIARPVEGPDKEYRITEQARALPDGYAPALTPRVALALQRHGAFGELKLSMAGSSDLRIARCWDDARACGVMVVDPGALARVELASRRREALERLSMSIPSALPLDRQDSLWLSLWDDELLRSCADASKPLIRFEKARSRLDDFAALKAALVSSDLAQVKALVGRLDAYPPLEEHRTKIDILLFDHGRIGELIAALDRYNQPSAGPAERQAADLAARESFDADVLARYPAALTRHRVALERWLRERVLGEPPVAASPPYVREPGLPPRVKVRWVWGDKVINTYRVTSDAMPPTSRAGSATQGVRIDHAALNRNGGWQVNLVGQNLFVSVWAVVDLGWAAFAGPPLVFGPINGTGGTSQPAGPPPPRRTGGNPWTRGGPGGLARP